VPAFQVQTEARFRRDIHGLPLDVLRRFDRAMTALADDPTHARPGLDVKRLHAYGEGMWRLRIGDYRILYHVAPSLVRVLRIESRRSAYA
jgi:mRNA-degrading endonuclease RelE of RelBE toxin-antitoxin system